MLFREIIKNLTLLSFLFECYHLNNSISQFVHESSGFCLFDMIIEGALFHCKKCLKLKSTLFGH